MTTQLDELLKECCKVCGLYRCQNHLDWLRCEACKTEWDATVFLGCPSCLEKDGKPAYRPRLKERCLFCKTKIPDGGLAYTDPTPGGTFCEMCARIYKIAFWTIKVQWGRLWTANEITSEWKKAG